MPIRFFLLLGLLTAGLLPTQLPARGQTLDPAFQPTVAYRDQLLPGTVRALCRQPDGRVLVAGDFILFNNWPTSNVARLWPDGRVDTTFLAPPFAGGQVLALAVDAQGRAVVGGTFGTVNGQPRNGVARLLATGALDPGFQPDVRPFTGSGGTGPIVRAVVVQPDDKVLLGGSFVAQGAGGAPVPHVVRLLTSGGLDASFAPAMPFSGQVGALALLPNGSILVAGNIFSNQLELVRRLLPSGALDPAFTIVPANQVLAGMGQALALTPTGFVLVGTFHSIGTVGRASVAQFLANGVLDQAFTSPLPGGVGPAAPVTAVAVEPSGEVFIGGELGAGVSRSFLRRLSPMGAVDFTYFGGSGSGPNAVVTALLLQPDGKLLVGGDFGSVAGQPRNGLARLLAPNALAVARTRQPLALRAYPNPVHDLLQLRFDAAQRPVRLQLLDARGSVVYTLPSPATELALPTRGLPVGLYLLRADYGQGRNVTERVVVE